MLKQFLFFVLVISPFLISGQNKGTTFSFARDTLKSKTSVCDSQLFLSYYRLFNITVDSNFLVIDSLRSHLNTDNLFDYIFIISNRIQEGYLKITDCNVKYNKRLMLIFLSKGNKYDTPIINENLILNSTEFQSDPYKSIASIKNGFQLKYYLGTRIRYTYDFFFKFDGKRDFFLYKSKKESYDIHVSGKNQNNEKNYSRSLLTNLKAIDIRNFIKY